MKTTVQKIASRFLLILFIIISLVVIIENVITPDKEIILPVASNSSNMKTISSSDKGEIVFDKAQIEIRQVIRWTEKNWWAKFIAPKDLFLTDSIYAFIILSCGTILLFATWYTGKEKPYSGNLSSALDWMSFLCLIGWVIVYFRATYFSSMVSSLTENRYSYAFNVFQEAILWISFPLQTLAYIIKRGENLQQEQDLTV